MPSIISIPTTTYWPIVEQNFKGTCRLHFVDLIPSYDGQEAIDKIRSKIDASQASPFIIGIFQKLLTRRVVGKARIGQAVIDSSHCPSSLRVYVEDFQSNLFLTEILDNPSYLRGDFSFINNNVRFSLRSGFRHPDALVGQEVIVISRALAKVRIAALVILWSFLSLAIGVCVGVASHQVDAGVGVGVGMFTLLALLQGLAAWFER